MSVSSIFKKTYKWPLPFYPFIKRELKQTSIYLIYLSLFTSSFEMFKPKGQATKEWRETVYSALQNEEGILSLGATLYCTALLNLWRLLSGQPTRVDTTLTLSWEVSVTAPLKGPFYGIPLQVKSCTWNSHKHLSKAHILIPESSFSGLWNRDVFCGSLTSSQAILWCSSN